MVRLYSSYLMRLWCLEEGELRIKLEHVQSGEKVQVETFGSFTRPNQGERHRR